MRGVEAENEDHDSPDCLKRIGIYYTSPFRFLDARPLSRPAI